MAQTPLKGEEGQSLLTFVERSTEQVRFLAYDSDKKTLEASSNEAVDEKPP